MRTIRRLAAIYELIDLPKDVVADIGCDHGHLGEMLIKNNRAKKVIATDISIKSLEKTRNLSERFCLEDRIECRVGDGLEPLKKNETALAVIAGMGGYQIIRILSSGGQKVKKFIFQPAQNAVELRRYLVSHNFKIQRDFIVKDKNKFYNTLEVVKSRTKQNLSPIEIEHGLTNFDLRSEDFKQFLLSDIRTREEILKDKQSRQLEERLARSKEIYKKLYEGE